MDDPGGGGEVQEAEKSSGKVSWVVGKGLALGKRVLVTGFVISSAPLVLPPLLVFSGIGLACLFPCGIFIASYACTEKIMSKLLPIASPPGFFLEYGGTDGGGGSLDMEMEEEECVSDGEIRARRGFEKSKDEFVEDEGENLEVNGYEQDNGEYMEEKEKPSAKKDVEVVGNEEEKEEVNNVKEQDAHFEVTSVVVEVSEWQDDSKDHEIEEETRGSMEKMGDEGVTDNRVAEVDDRNVENVGEGAKGGDQEVVRNVEVTETEDRKAKAIPPKVVEVEPVRQAAPKKKLSSRKKKQRNAENGGLPGKNDAVQERKSGVDKTATARGVDKQDDAIATASKQDTRSNGKKEVTTYATPEVPEESEHPSSFELTTRPETDTGMPSEKPMAYSEEKVWSKINAVRAIIGYTASPQASCIHELKDLYLFVGVEPPAFFKDPSDPVEINDRLRFLMLIVGVK